MKLNNKDRQLLALLQSDCRIPNAELAEKVGMSPSACWRRVRALEEAGVIERYGAVLSSARLGLTFQAVVHVQLTRHDPDALQAFIEGVASRGEVQACYATTGQADYHLLIKCENLETFNQFQDDFLFQLPAIRSAQTNLVLREIATSGADLPH